MTSVSDLQTRLAALKRARDTGVLSVRHGEDSTTYRSVEEMERIIASLEIEIAELNGDVRRRVRYPYQSDKGL